MPERISVPAPALLKPPLPESAPDSVFVMLAAASNVTEPLRFVRFIFSDDAQLALDPSVPPPRLSWYFPDWLVIPPAPTTILPPLSV